MFSTEGFVRPAVVAATLIVLLGSAPSPAEEELTHGGLTLRDALALALERNPELTAFSWEVRAAEARALQAGLRPNPTLSVDLENVAGSGEFSGVNLAETTLVLSQLIELGGKRQKRLAVGARETEVAEREYQAVRLDVVLATTGAFAEALAAQERVRLADVQLHRAGELLEVILAQDRSPEQRLRSDLEVTNEEIDRRQSVRTLHVAKVRLATTWGSMEPDFSRLEGDLYSVSEIPEERDLVERLAKSPELARWRAEVAQRRAEIVLEDAQRIPDVELGIGPRHINIGPLDEDSWVLVAGVQLPIPVFDRNQGARREARNELAGSRDLQRSAQLRLRLALALAYSGLISSYEEVIALRDDALPTAKRAYDATLAGQRRGSVPLNSVLDAQRSLSELETRLVEVLTSYHQHRAELEALIGGPLDAGKGSNP